MAAALREKVIKSRPVLVRGAGGRSWSFNAYCAPVKANLTYFRVCACVCIW